MKSRGLRLLCGTMLGTALGVFGLLGTFSPAAFAQNPVPFVNQPLVPDATAPGGPEFTLTVNGTGFVSGSVVNWNTTALATQFVSGSQLTATVPAADIATASTASVTVVNPAPGGGTSNLAFFSVTANTGDSLAFTLASYPGLGSYGLGFFPGSVVAVSDFNGDGKLDLALANCPGDAQCRNVGAVSILLGDGADGFTLASSPATGVLPSSIAVGDFNGDGKPDLAVTNATDNTVSILLGDGAGNFTQVSSPAVGGDPWSVAEGDFNEDGKLDLAVTNGGDDTVSILLGDGTGNFTQASSPATGSGPISVATGDFNGDGKLDLAVADGSDISVCILLGDGAGNFTLASFPVLPSPAWSMALGDFNGDGELDVVALGNPWSNTVSILLGDGTGNLTLASSLDVGSFPESVALGDFNGDGKLDLAVASTGEQSTISILLGDGTGNFTVASSLATTGPLAAGDFNGDGRLDLAAMTWNEYGEDLTISLFMQGALPAVTLSPTSLTFGEQLVSTASGSQAVTLTNTSGAPLNITGIVATGDFAQTNTCGNTLAIFASCSVSVTFTPTDVGARTGSITISDNAAGSPQIVSLVGTGVASGGNVTVSAASLSFSNQPVQTTSAAQTVTLTNLGSAALSVTSIAASGDFAETNTCGNSLASGASCGISVTFDPTAVGTRTGAVTITDNAPGSPQVVNLTGVAVTIPGTTPSSSLYAFGRADFATGASPVFLVTGDFNSDGKPDVATANSGDNTVSVLIGKPDGTFQPHVDYKVGSSPSALVAGDFNGDGKLDLAVVNSADGTVSILLGKGDGTFEVSGPYGVGKAPASVATGDFNGDGKLDLTVANSGSNSVSIMIGHGDGTFDAPVDYAVGKSPVSVALGDFNGDGKLDLAVANGAAGTVSILLGRGDGSLATATNYAAEGVSSLAVGDLNGDGKLDLMVAGTDTAAGMLGNGDGTFQPVLSLGSSAGPTFVVLKDLDGDGKLDWVVTGTLSDAGAGGVLVYFGGRLDGTPYLLVNPTGHLPWCVAVADFNGDGALDLAVTNSSSNVVSILLGNFSASIWTAPGATIAGTFGQEVDDIYSQFDHYWSTGPLAAADFNGDGKAESALVNVCNDYCEFSSITSGVFVGGVNYATGSIPSALATGDFNEDGKQDLAVLNAGYMGTGSVAVLLGNGDSTFQPALTFGRGWTSMVVGDFNGDGRLDLAVSDGSTISVLFGNGDGTFLAVNTGSVGVPLGVGDFNGDGKLDLVVADQNNNVSLLLGNGDGNFRSPIITGAAGGLVAVADFNSDGRLDLAVANGASSIVALLLGNGDGTFQAPVNYILSSPVSMRVADFNGDGVPDLAVLSGTSLSSGSVSLLLGAPGGGLQILPGLLRGQVWDYFATADFDGDGAADLAGHAYRFPVAYLGGGSGQTSIGTFFNRPVIALYPNQLTFSAESGGAQSVTVSNPGLLPLKISSVTVTGDFTETNDCGSPVLSTAFCTVSVTPTLTGPGTSTGSISITDNAPGSPHLISLAATVPSESDLNFTPASLSFGNQQMASTSAKLTVIVSSTGNAPLTITSIAASGDFAQTNNCGGSVASGASCAISVTFTPTAPGARTGTITINDNAPGSPQVVTLTGTGSGPAVTLSAGAMSVGGQVVGTSSAAHTVTLTNSGNAALSITGMTTSSASFSETNTCGASLAAGASCTITVTFTPSVAGETTGTLAITDNASGSPHQVTLSGVGQDFTIGPYDLTQTVNPGAAISYVFEVGPLGGFNQTVSLACSGAPQGATCTLSPASAVLDGRTHAVIRMNLSTTAPAAGGMARSRWPAQPPSGEWRLALRVTMLLGLASLMFLTGSKPHTPRLLLRVLTGFVMILMIGWVACGGGGKFIFTSPTGGTPAGTYTLTVTATSAHLTHSTTAQLRVR